MTPQLLDHEARVKKYKLRSFGSFPSRPGAKPLPEFPSWPQHAEAESSSVRAILPETSQNFDLYHADEPCEAAEATGTECTQYQTKDATTSVLHAASCKETLRDFFHAFADRGRFTLHLDVLRAANGHHAAEAAFKATALALRQAVARRTGDHMPSTKGTLTA